MLSDEQIRKNLRHVIDASALRRKRLRRRLVLIQRAQQSSEWIGGRKARNLLPKLIEVGINGNWFIAGIGPMYAKDFAVKGMRNEGWRKSGSFFSS